MQLESLGDLEGEHDERHADADEQEARRGRRGDGDHDSSRDEAQCECDERGADAQLPRNRLAGQQSPRQSHEAGAVADPRGGLDFGFPPAGHLGGLSACHDAIDGKRAPSPAPEFERGACLLERRRAAHLLDQQVVGIEVLHARDFSAS
jgi:hypothetical protein